MFRYSATKRIIGNLKREPVVSNLGPTSDELWHASDRDRNFYTYGSMGLCSSIALGMAYPNVRETHRFKKAIVELA